MQNLEHTLFDFPDDPGDLDWEKEALLFYYYMLNEEEKYEKKVRKIFEKYKAFLVAYNERSLNEKKAMFNELKLELYKVKHQDNNFQRALLFILLTSKVINKLEGSIDYISNAKLHAESALKLFPNETELFQKQLEDLAIEEEKAINKALNGIVRIVRTESWRFVNETRLEEFKKKGYEYKTTYPVKDDRTGDDSWFYYDMKQIKPIDEPFSYEWKGKERVFMTPPDRANDRQILIPYIDNSDNI